MFAAIRLRQPVAGLLAHEPPWLRDAIMACVTLQTYRSGEYTRFAGDTSGDMFGIARGSFGVLIPAPAGELTLCHVLPAGSWFGLKPILTEGTRNLTYRALEKSYVLQASHADLRAIAARYPVTPQAIRIVANEFARKDAG